MNYIFAILSLTGALVCAAMGVYICLRNPRNLSNIGFSLGLGTFVLIEAGSAANIINPAYDNVFFSAAGNKLFFWGLAASPSAWLVFCLTFARANQKEILSKWSPVLIISSFLSAFFIFESGSPGFVQALTNTGSVFGSRTGYLTFGPLGKYFLICLILGLVLNLVQLENTFRSSAGEKRWQIKYIIFAVGAVFAYFIYFASQALLFSSLRSEMVPLTSAIILISAAMMAVFIAKHRLLEVDIFVSRYVIYNSFTILVVGIYIIITGLVAQGIKYFNLPFHYFITSLFIFTSILALVVFLFTASLRRKIKLFINTHFYKHKYEFRDKWMETIERIGPKDSVDEIVETLMEMISQDMCAKTVLLWLYEPVSRTYSSFAAPPSKEIQDLTRAHGLIKHLTERLAPFLRSEELAPEVIEAFDRTGTVLCAPLAAGPEVVGFVMLGPDIAGEPYVNDDFEFIKALTTQAAVQIKNIRLSMELLDSKQVEAFSRMSSFIMHDLKNLTNSLSLISQNARANMGNPEFQQDAIRTIDATVSRMKKLIEKLSNLPRDIDLKKEDADLSEIINRVLRKLALPSDNNVVVAVDIGPIKPIYIDPEAIEMVFLNIVNNAIDAVSGKGHIQIKAYPDGGFVRLSVSDTGHGIPSKIAGQLFQPFKTTKKNGIGIGLYQSKAIIEAHGGAIEFKSVPGKGAEFTVRLPAGPAGRGLHGAI